MESRDLVVRFAGEGGQGVVTASEMLARAAASVGYHVQTFATFPSQIMGDPPGPKHASLPHRSSAPATSWTSWWH